MSSPEEDLNPDEIHELVRERSIQLCLGSLLHAGRCQDANCQMVSCYRMKVVLRHSKRCTLKVNGGCSVCIQLTALCYHHSKYCKTPNCTMPICWNNKREAGRALLNAIVPSIDNDSNNTNDETDSSVSDEIREVFFTPRCVNESSNSNNEADDSVPDEVREVSNDSNNSNNETDSSVSDLLGEEMSFMQRMADLDSNSDNEAGSSVPNEAVGEVLSPENNSPVWVEAALAHLSPEAVVVADAYRRDAESLYALIGARYGDTSPTQEELVRRGNPAVAFMSPMEYIQQQQEGRRLAALSLAPVNEPFVNQNDPRVLNPPAAVQIDQLEGRPEIQIQPPFDMAVAQPPSRQQRRRYRNRWTKRILIGKRRSLMNGLVRKQWSRRLVPFCSTRR